MAVSPSGLCPLQPVFEQRKAARMFVEESEA